MASVDLLFSELPITGSPVDLLFGPDTPDAPAAVDLTLAGVLPKPELQASIVCGVVTNADLAGVIPQPALTALLDVRQVYRVDLAGVLPPPVQLTALIGMEYNSNTARPTIGQTLNAWQPADPRESGIAEGYQQSIPLPNIAAAPWNAAMRTAADTSAGFGNADRLSNAATSTHQDGQRLSVIAQNLYSDAQRGMRQMLSTAFENALKGQTQVNRQRHQDGFRDRRSAIKGRWQVAIPNRIVGTTGTSSPAVWLIKGWDADHENAMRPPAGMYVRPVIVPPREVCYIPDANLLFDMPWLADTNLLFFCERYIPPAPGAAVVVPIRRTYVTINSITLRRIDGNVTIPTYAFQMSLDADSWSWSWSASIPLAALALVQPGSDGAPVEVEALVNGVPYRLLAEGVASQRQFAQGRIAVKGRGKAAMLDAPYAPTLNFGNAEARTAQQCMTDVLTVNGVGIGWSVDWGLTDWLVPGNTWTSQGAYIGAILDIAQAAGGYVQPHNTAQTLRILPRYPSVPWSWASTVTPDFELPSAMVTVEGIDWRRKAAYNRIFVSGIGAGVLGQVTRAGTAGDSVAPIVTHSLITHAIAARQRGLAELSDTGKQAYVSLKLPVLEETGLILPGKFVRYGNGSETHLGLTRGISLDWSRPVLRQTVLVETHEATP